MYVYIYIYIYIYILNVGIFIRVIGAFAKLPKATINFVTNLCPPVRPSVRPSVRLSEGTTRLSLDGFLWNLIFEYISKICREKLSFPKI